MGSDIQVSSELAKGSRFWFEIVIPVSEQGIHVGPVLERQRIVGYRGERPRVLLVDDVRKNRMVLRDMLVPLGFLVEEAENGQEGVQKTLKTQRDLVFMDLFMPVMTGFEATQTIRTLAIRHSQPESGNPVIVAISASVLNSEPDVIREKGFDGFLFKPVDRHELLTALKKHLTLEWICADMVYREENTSISADNMPMVAPPLEELKTLYELAAMGLMERIERQVDSLAMQDRRYAAFARTVKDLTLHIEDEQLLLFFEQCLTRLS